MAGAGFGKSALLIETLETNRRDPLGIDAWVGCQVEDTGLDRFFAAVFTAVRGEPPKEWPVDLDDAVNRIADAVWSHAPSPVSILVDDVHHLSDGSPGARLLDALVRRLPASTRFVLTSRSAMPLALARLRAVGDAVVLTEAELVMTDVELEELSARRGAPDLDLSATGGWPALAELAVHVGAASSPELLAHYLTEELLADLSTGQLKALAVLCAVGPLTADELVAVTVDPGLDVESLARLPLVDSVADRLDPHALWGVVTGFVEADWLRRATVTAAELLRARGDSERAFGLAVAAEDWSLGLEILGDLCRRSLHNARTIDLASCVAVLPPDARSAPVGVLAAALAHDPIGWPASRGRLIEASIALDDAGAAGLELVALTRLGILGWQAGDLSVAEHLLPRIDRLASSGDPLASGVVELIAVLMAEIAGDHGEMWSRMSAFEALGVAEPLHTLGHRLRASLELQYGSSEAALRRLVSLEASVPDSSMRVELRALTVWASWLDGDVRSAGQWVEQLRSEADDRDVVARSNVALFDAWWPPSRDRSVPGAAGGRAEAGDGTALVVAEAAASSAAARDAGWMVPSLVLALAAATRLVTEGDEAAAREVLVAAFGHPTTTGLRARSAAVRGLALVWVLLPEWHDQLQDLERGRGPAAAVAAARALRGGRDGSPNWRDQAREVLSDERLPTTLPAIWVAELAARFVGAERADEDMRLAQGAVDLLGPFGASALRRVAANATDPRVVTGANAILARRAPVSEGRFVLRLLGPMTLEREGVEVDHPDWRRDRVRGLFALIARHGTVTRRSATEVLWPDLGPDAGANNLRVTLSYLQKVLEPERTRHEVAYHVRGDGVSLRFAGRSSWTIDAEEFESLLDTAERDDRRGESATALGGYLAAIDWYRGPFLTDVNVASSDEFERERLCSRYVRALIRAGGLLLAVGRVDEAQRLAVAAQAADEWSDLALCLQAEAYLTAGDRSAALRTARRAAELTAELGLSPSPELRRLDRALAAPVDLGTFPEPVGPGGEPGMVPGPGGGHL